MASARFQRALTLIELLVVVAIIGLLAGIAYPSYRSSVLRSHRLEAIESLLAVATAQESYRFDHGHYAGTLADPTGVEGLRLARQSPQGYYRLELSTTETGGYVASAEPQPGSGQEADRRCSLFSLRADGLRRAQDIAGRDTTGDCWR